MTKEPSGGGRNTGIGLGVHICKHILGQHGGIIGAESEKGRSGNLKGTNGSFDTENMADKTSLADLPMGRRRALRAGDGSRPPVPVHRWRRCCIQLAK